MFHMGDDVKILAVAATSAAAAAATALALGTMLEAVDDGLATPQEYLPALRDQARRLAALVENLFELARIDSGALAHELRPVSLVGLVDWCLRGVAAEAAARQARLERRIQQAPAAVRCAPEQVE